MNRKFDLFLGLSTKKANKFLVVFLILTFHCKILAVGRTIFTSEINFKGRCRKPLKRVGVNFFKFSIMSKLEAFKKYHIGYGSTNYFRGGYIGGSHVGCVDCDGSTTYCANSTKCVEKSCPEGNDLGGSKALACG